MIIHFYPDSRRVEDTVVTLSRFFKLIKNQPKLYALIISTLEKVSYSSNLEDLFRQGWVGHLKHTKYPILEFKIPPKKKREGVVRLYFGYMKNKPNNIMILTAEFKQGRSAANKEIIKQAEQRYMEVCL